MNGARDRIQLTAAEKFWYLLQCIWFGAGYFAKVPSQEGSERRGSLSDDRRRNILVRPVLHRLRSGLFRKDSA